MHVLSLKEYDGKWIKSIVDRGLDIKKRPDKYANALQQKTLAMIFQKSSTRTRLSFETGMTKLGGHGIFVDWRTTQLALGGVQDEAKVISGYADAIMVRPLKHATVAEFAKASRVPVINGLCEKYHPCQALADAMTIQEKMGKLKGVKVVYLGIANNVSNSLSVACARTGADFTLCVPERDPDSIDQEQLQQLKAMPNYHETHDVSEAVEGADILYTDTWVNMEFFNDPKFAKEKTRREKLFMPYQLNKALLEKAGPQAFSMHDMPAHIGYEIDAYALRGERSLAFVQAENRMWAQMALMIELIRK
ncbi:ornithine carbamoyltransferase [Candidatus Micrarchaeota archaeon]|nr:ornithine carbamoyltransferase [Candidatus Micrarchaeota archaeon]